MYVVAVTRLNSNAVLVFQFIYKLIDVFRSYFGGMFNEDSLRNNFVLIYELLDEMMDNGFPQVTAPNILSNVIR